MHKFHYDSLNETLYFEELDNGLSVYLLKKPGFLKSYATLSTNLGSTTHQLYDGHKMIDLPNGIAHFLEHSMFDQNGQDVSQLFAAQDATVNAYTQFNRTTFLFSCTNHIKENLTTLLDFVQFPTFTKDNVQKEIGIITQEIKMYQDDASAVSYMGTLKNLYASHPIRDDILGTEETIKKITKKTLELTHKTFYHPRNMVLFVTGDFDPEEMIAHIRNNQKSKTFENVPKQPKQVFLEPHHVMKHSEIKEFDIHVPHLILGIKLDCHVECENPIKKELVYSILFDLLLGKTTKRYERLLEMGLINDSFGMEVSLEADHGYIMIGSETMKTAELVQELLSILLEEPFRIDKAHFLRTKKQITGGFIQALNSLEYIANQFTKFHYQNSVLFDILEVAKTITVDDIEEAYQSLQDEQTYTEFILIPKENDA